MRPLVQKIKPSRGFPHSLYVLLNVLLPFVVLVLVETGFVSVAGVIILLSKWRMFAVRPRFWLANIRTNAVDLIVGLSTLAMLDGTQSELTRLVYVSAWILWLILVKPRNDVLWVSLQALVGQVLGLSALFSAFDHASLLTVVFLVGVVCFFSAHHFFYSFEEEYIRLLAYLWAYFGAALAWITSHWLIFYYPVIAQPTLLLSTIAFSVGTLYYLDHFDKLSKVIRRQIIFILITIITVIIVFSDWGDKIV